MLQTELQRHSFNFGQRVEPIRATFSYPTDHRRDVISSHLARVKSPAEIESLRFRERRSSRCQASEYAVNEMPAQRIDFVPVHA
ncbi:MAG TPA: hypothetical protein VGI19_10840 [Candidatus Cybelea sp.]